METKTKFSKDPENKKMVVVRNFDAPLKDVWAAWTEKELLEQWWAPEPWKAKSKDMNFTEGGSWLYAMVGPDGTEIWSKINFHKIKVLDYYTATDCFCDEKGVVNKDFPSMEWKNTFRESGDGTQVEVEILFASKADLEKILEMGFEEGFAMAHGNLDRVLKNMSK